MMSESTSHILNMQLALPLRVVRAYGQGTDLQQVFIALKKHLQN